MSSKLLPKSSGDFCLDDRALAEYAASDSKPTTQCKGGIKPGSSHYNFDDNMMYLIQRKNSNLGAWAQGTRPSLYYPKHSRWASAIYYNAPFMLLLLTHLIYLFSTYHTELWFLSLPLVSTSSSLTALAHCHVDSARLLEQAVSTAWLEVKRKSLKSNYVINVSAD